MAVHPIIGQLGQLNSDLSYEHMEQMMTQDINDEEVQVGYFSPTHHLHPYRIRTNSLGQSKDSFIKPNRGTLRGRKPHS